MGCEILMGQLLSPRNTIGPQPYRGGISPGSCIRPAYGKPGLLEALQEFTRLGEVSMLSEQPCGDISNLLCLPNTLGALWFHLQPEPSQFTRTFNLSPRHLLHVISNRQHLRHHGEAGTPLQPKPHESHPGSSPQRKGLQTGCCRGTES